MTRRDHDEAHTDYAAQSAKLREPRRIILIIADSGTVSERLIHALEREIPWVVIEQVEHVAAACQVFPHPVSLILVGSRLLDGAEARSADLLRLHPQAQAAVIEPSDDNLPLSSANVSRSPLVRSLLPMNLRLDVWLSVVRLMLCGGEYLPPALILRSRQNGHSAGPLLNDGARAAHVASADSEMAGLTARELQILEMVSRGLQNKIIAAEIRLSENTVKIHLHNIITKLGAHNRTEAAARFRSLQERH
ncbi:helix-turn-helix transcriptional regulator [Sinorhizobium meliloti]|uniref:helix-turn-helix transcriptional regulator n=1 Tax=Rhizobium meliloti TaxID=382 RepID=UPI003F13DE09